MAEDSDGTFAAGLPCRVPPTMLTMAACRLAIHHTRAWRRLQVQQQDAVRGHKHVLHGKGT